jgi:hypothetical protein
MQSLLSDAVHERSILGDGLGMVMRNKRYIFWFWLLDLVFGFLGTSAFRDSARPILENSAFSDRLLHGFDLSVMFELYVRPEFGSMAAVSTAAVCFAVAFFLATVVFLPGVFQGYASSYRLPREDFFRACGRNLWRFIRLLIIAGIVMGIATGILFAIHGAIVKKAGDSTYELLPVILQVVGLTVIFLIMTTLRIWFDLAEADIVLNDQNATRKSVAAGFRHTFRHLSRLLGSYVVATLFGAIFLVGGIWAWIHFVPAEGIVRAFLLSQFVLLLLLIPRFWQRGVAVSYWQQYMLIPVVAALPIAPVVVPTPVVVEPVPVVEPPSAIEPSPVLPPPPPEPSVS